MIVPREIKELEDYGVAKIFSPDDGREMGLDGMISSHDRGRRLRPRDRWTPPAPSGPPPTAGWRSRAPSPASRRGCRSKRPKRATPAPVLGITGTGGAGKSSLTDELVLRFLADDPDRTIAILSIDPTKRKTGGALLGDRIRLNSLGSDRVFMRSLATRQAHRALTQNIDESIFVCQSAGFDLIIVESSGIGQADSEIVDISDISLYVMTPEYGAAMQLEKIDMLDYADFVAINKFDRPKALDALRDVRKQYRRCHELFDGPDDDELPVYGTVASQFHDHGVNALYQGLVSRFAEDFGKQWSLEGTSAEPAGEPERHPVIPGERAGYLREISRAVRGYKEWAEAQIKVAAQLYQLVGARAILCARKGEGDIEDLWNLFEEILAEEPGTEPQLADIDAEIRRISHQLEEDSRKLIAAWPEIREDYAGHDFTYTVRGEVINVPLTSKSLAGTEVPKVQLPLAHHLARNPPLPLPGERAGRLPLHRRRLSPQAHRRVTDPDVRRRGRPGAHQRALPPPVRRPARQPPLDRLRLGHPLRRGPRHPPRHLGQGRRGRGLDLHRRGCGTALRRLRPLRQEDLGVDDHQRPGADDPGHVLQRRRPPAGAQEAHRIRPPRRPSPRPPSSRWSTARTGRPSSRCSKTASGTRSSTPP